MRVCKNLHVEAKHSIGSDEQSQNQPTSGELNQSKEEIMTERRMAEASLSKT